MFTNMLSCLKESPDLVFWACALFGTVLFILRAFVSCFAYSGDDDFSHELSCDHGGAHDGFDSHDISEPHGTVSSFRLFTMHSIAGFFMMFGWAGLACFKQLEYSHLTSITIAFFVGLVTMVLTALIFKGAMLLVSTGSRFDIKKAMGLVGTVYNNIPQNGLGKIQIDVDGVTREILARSVNNSEIGSFKLVKVVQILDHEVVVVKEINS